jgi:hypothetical protein
MLIEDRVNCEMGSFIYLDQRGQPHNDPGKIIQTLDVLDFSVIHLSAYERSIKRYMKAVSSLKKLNITRKMMNVTATLKVTSAERSSLMMKSIPSGQRKKTLRVRFNSHPFGPVF